MDILMKPDHIIYGEVDHENTFTRRPYYPRRCSIVVTLMDAEVTAVDLQRMMEAGMSMTRFKMSNHTKGEKIRILNRIKEASEACCKKFGVPEWPITTSIELKTWIHRTGVLQEYSPGANLIKDGAEVILTSNVKFFDKCNCRTIFVDNAHLAEDTKVGSEIYIGCDEIMLICKQKIDNKSIKCVAVSGGTLENAATVGIRGIIRNRPVLNERDLERIQFALDNDVDLITINYVDQKSTIQKVRKLIEKKKDQQPFILSGICTEQALNSMDDILKVSDAIVVSREFLPYEISASKKYRLNNIQKWVAAKCHQVGKPVFLSGTVFVHALRTGVFNHIEIADITNAILDGFTGFILRDCASVDNTVKVIKFLDKLCCSIRPLHASSIEFWQLSDQLKLPINAAEAALMSCVAMANKTEAKAIVMLTLSGRTARTLLRMRPTCLVLAICSSPRVARMMHLYKCIMPILLPSKYRDDVDHNDDNNHTNNGTQTQARRISFGVEYAVKMGWLTYGDSYVSLQRSSFSCYCDLVSVMTVSFAEKKLEARIMVAVMAVDKESLTLALAYWSESDRCVIHIVPADIVPDIQHLPYNKRLQHYPTLTMAASFDGAILNYIPKIKLGTYDAMELPGQQLPSANAVTPLDHILNLDIKAPPGCQRLTGIMATMGRSTNDVDTAESMIAAGMNVAILTMNYGTKEEHIEMIKILRLASKNYSMKMGRNYPLAIAARLSGRKIRTGRIADSYGEEVELKTGDVVRLTSDETYKERCSTYTIFVDFMYFGDQVKKGDVVLLDNEKIMLKVEMISSTTTTCKIERGGYLGSYKDVFVPNVVWDMPNYSEKDKSDIEMGIHHQVDLFVAPFVNSSDDIKALRAILGEKGKKIAIIATIQTIEGFERFDDILSEADGIMISRQELGSDITPKKLVIAQKNMLARANKANVPVSISAQLLSSMRKKRMPLRAELLDISNCIIDGADALVLSAETAVGHFPVETVAVMASTCKEAEACVWTKQIYHDMIEKTPIPCDAATGTALAAVLAANRTIAAAIIVVTTTGKSAEIVSKFKPRCPIVAVTRYAVIARQLHLFRGIVPVIYEDPPETDWQVDLEHRVNYCIRWMMTQAFIRVGDPIVVVSGWRQGSGFTNTMRIIYANADPTSNTIFTKL